MVGWGGGGGGGLRRVGLYGFLFVCVAGFFFFLVVCVFLLL